MKVLLSICLLLCLALSANAVRVKTHAKSQSTASQGSWQSYVDDQLIGSGYSSGAVIIGLDGYTWVANNLRLKPGEGLAIVRLFKDPVNIFASGVTVGGIKYLGIKGDEYSLHGRKGATGVSIAKTNYAVIISTYNEPIQPGNAALVVEKLADYLREDGY